ncbi:hypothetical protein LOTGIDRAFT_229608 [Lottia gigantea]|uniref:folate gamma-glutamyl hydrolase n=1 Tax=Lottia gigantea TaxID=225164 RepID=V3Z0S8_LOTGI|nr:hypothetical protein LOTGIDRAFT_229608 [Lottia gigantea]ESO84108.1 hypothetical protein LOTGIDRAFT_229608 [Lottia gigantea]
MMVKAKDVFKCITIFIVLFLEVESTNLRPIIGILTQKVSGKEETFIPASYVNYLEASGARVVPVRADQPKRYYEKAFSQINGVLFPGGGVGLISSYYAHSGRYIYDLAIKANDEGDFFPLWGTCQGFQLLTNLTADVDLLSSTDSENLPLPLNISKSLAGKSRLFGPLPSRIYDFLTQKPVTYNNHHYSMTTKTFHNTKSLYSFYNVLSTNTDREGIEFVSTFEAKDYPFYGVQWHPEKNNFVWNPKLNIDHDESAVEVSQYMSNFLVAEARKSNHKFQNSTSEIQAMIDNYKRSYHTDGTFEVIYYFNLENSKFDTFL